MGDDNDGVVFVRGPLHKLFIDDAVHDEPLLFGVCQLLAMVNQLVWDGLPIEYGSDVVVFP